MVMDRWIFGAFCLILVFNQFSSVSGNAEGDALNALKNNLEDPNNVLQSWDATLVNPCTWFHVTCNNENSVTRVDLGNANLSGQLVTQLGQLPNLQYLELYSNNISGRVPNELGNLTNLVSLDLYLNNLNGPIPDTLKKLQKLRFLRLNNNTLTGTIPFSLTTIGSLQVLDLSNNRLTGPVPVNGSFTLFTPISFNGNLLDALPVSPPPPLPPSPPSSKAVNSATGAIAGGVAAGAALLFAGPAIALAWWRKKKPQDHFFDVPAEEDPEVHLGQLKRFSLRELQVATDNFSNKNILGRGGFGKVYKGRLADGTLVAVKRLKEERTQGGELTTNHHTQREKKRKDRGRGCTKMTSFCSTTLIISSSSSAPSTCSLLSSSSPPSLFSIRRTAYCNGTSIERRPVVVAAARMGEEEKLTRRNPLDFPIEWERPKPGRRPDIFPQFSPMKTPLPPPMPYDPPEEDEEEEEKKEEEEDPEKEEGDNPESRWFPFRW